ncbi:trypsin [Drosophila virilis]|uniref:Peptidase S1 domain-containing protein n=1 Tax=Drosophila virilis TaxID=7244 RepID=B4LZH5_DROVI|nr:trypsin [Drosophila virilis]EDW67114.2 uncharacterized protein Dvir_GJ23977 [Drosophila virilis]
MFISQGLIIALVCLTAAAAAEQTVETHAKIVGGYPITIADVPYIVSIRVRYYHEKEFGLGHICGGALITERVVCSAAHCFAENGTIPVKYRGSENYVVVAGGSNLNEKDSFTQVYLVQEIIGHHKYYYPTLENDIALVFLNGLIPSKYPTIRPLPLAERPANQGTLCLISGWGNKYKQLRQAIVPVVPQNVCSIIYFFLPQTQMCAGWLRGGIDACKGDSGGPLVCGGHLTGIISWGVDCGRMFFPGVYTNISNFTDWIRSANSSLDYADFTLRSLHNQASRSHFSLKLYVVYSALLTAIIIQAD